ncbi:MAG: arginine--tRNA ligase [Candidatus Thorarchaeota archaeon]
MTQSETDSNPWSAFFDEVAIILAEAASVDIDTIKQFMETPPDPKLGDIATTISFHLAKQLKKNPAQIAGEIVLKLNPLIEKTNLLDRVESKGPYINLFYNRAEYVSRTIKSVSKMGPDYGQTKEFAGKRVLIEFPAVNPSKPWHIGHTRNSVLGDTLGNVLKAVGYDVTKLDYINDLGLQIAQLVWKLMQIEEKDVDAKYDQYLGHLYVEVQDAFENDKKAEEEIREVSRQLEDLSSDAAGVSLEMVTNCLKAQNQTAYRLGIYHDYQIWESAIAHSGLLDTAREMMLKAENIVVLEEGEMAGCIVARLDTIDEFKDMSNPNKALFRSDGTRTYTGADVALQMWKFGILKDPFKYQVFETQPNGQDVYRTALEGESHDLGRYDLVFNVIGAEQAHPQRLIYAILEILGYPQQSVDSHHVAYEHVGLEEASFSGRKGTWVGYSCDVVLDRACELAREEVAKRNLDETEEFKDKVAEQVGTGAVRYFLLNASPDRQITFRWNEALDFNGDAAPYLQYSHARATRIIEKGGMNSDTANLSLLTHDAEFALAKAIARFPEEVLETATGLQKNPRGTSFQSNKITTYCYNLATLFSKFYDNCPVLKADANIKAARLELVKTFRRTMENCLRLIGVPAVERM